MKKRESASGGNASLASVLGGNAMYSLIRPAVLPAEQPQEQNRQVVAAAPSPETSTSAIAPTTQENKPRIQQPVNDQQAFPPALHVPLSPKQAKSIKLRSKL